MDKHDMPHFEIPADMRAMAERSVEQARIAFNSFMTAAHEAITTFENHAEAAQAGAKDLSGKAVSYAERNVANTLAFADRLLHAKDAHDFIRLQTDFIEQQMKELTTQAKELASRRPIWR